MICVLQNIKNGLVDIPSETVLHCAGAKPSPNPNQIDSITYQISLTNLGGCPKDGVLSLRASAHFRILA